MNTLIIGFGEVGRAHFENLSKAYGHSIFYKDAGPEIFNHKGHRIDPHDLPKIHLLLIAMRCDPDDMGPFNKAVIEYAVEYSPEIVDILTTTPCGTCEKIQENLLGISITRSSTRGMHPNLAKFLLDIPKHIGGDKANKLAKYYEKAGWTCVCHKKTRAVELFHVLNNFIYGVNIMAADEAAQYCRDNGVDYMEFLKYRETNNTGFVKAGYPSKVSPILYPSSKLIGGHCIVYAPTTIPEDKRGKLAKLLAGYNAKSH